MKQNKNKKTSPESCFSSFRCGADTYFSLERVAAVQEEFAEEVGELLSYVTENRGGVKRLQVDRLAKRNRIKLYDVVIRQPTNSMT